MLQKEREMIEEWSGKPFILDYERLMHLFKLSGRPKEGLKNRELYTETMEVLRYFKSHGYKIGVISYTSPSLQKSLEVLGVDPYIDSYTYSDLVGVMKPDPKIYQAALDSLNVEAKESIYVDDYAIEADGARNMGFTSFYLDRNKESHGQWVIHNFKELIEYVENKFIF